MSNYNAYSLLSGLKKLNQIKPDSNWANKNKEQLLSYFSNNFSAQPSGPAFHFLKLQPVLATFIILGVILTTGIGTIYAAKNSLPGQPLYAVKKLTEKVRLAVTINPADKNILRADLLNTRAEEAKILARRVRDNADDQAAKNLVAVVADMKSSIHTLRQEILIQNQSNTTNQTEPIPTTSSDQDIGQENGSLPVQDGKQIASLILSQDVEKSLAETKELLAKKDLSTALTKTTEVDQKLTLSPQTIEPKTENTSSPESASPVNTKPVLKKNANVNIKPVQPTQDFIAPIIYESPVQTGLIREK